MEWNVYPLVKICDGAVVSAGRRSPRPPPPLADTEAAIRRHRERIGALPGGPIARVSAPGDRYEHHARPAGAILIHLEAEDTSPFPVWSKRVENPAAAFRQMRRSYDRAAARGLASPIPEPYFFDGASGQLFLAVMHGRPLRSLVFRHCLGLRPVGGKPAMPVALDLPETLHGIGEWLSRYHEAVRSDAPFDPDALAAAIIDRIEQDASLDYASRQDAMTRVRDACEAQRGLHGARFELWPHNDFTLRNLLIDDAGAFFVLDWDAMVHPAFSPLSSGWWDVTLFMLNLQSLARFRPAVRASRLRALATAFLSGYLGEDGDTIGRDRAASLLYLFTLRYWYAVGTDRSLARVYRRRLGWRYVRTLRRALFVHGTADILGEGFAR
jgi:hypothetical protein